VVIYRYKSMTYIVNQ